MMTLFPLISAQSVEHFASALSLTGAVGGLVIGSGTAGKLAMRRAADRGADLGAVIDQGAGGFRLQGILNPLLWACKSLIASDLGSEHMSQHTDWAGTGGQSARSGGGFQTGAGGVERAARVRSYEYIGALKIYWHCPVSRAVARVGEVGLTSWDSHRCPIKKRRSGGWRCGGGW